MKNNFDLSITQRPVMVSGVWENDVLDLVSVELPENVFDLSHAIVIAADSSYDSYLDDLLGSIVAYGEVGKNSSTEVTVFIFSYGNSEDIKRVVDSYRDDLKLCVLNCQAANGADSPEMWKKLPLFSHSRFFHASYVLLLETDTLVFSPLLPLFNLAHRDPNNLHVISCGDIGCKNLSEWMDAPCENIEAALNRSLPKIVPIPNSGVIVGSRSAWEMFLDEIESVKYSLSVFQSSHPSTTNRIPFCIDILLGSCEGIAYDLPYLYNLSLLYVEDEVFLGYLRSENPQPFPVAAYQGDRVGILHFDFISKRDYRSWRGHFCRLYHEL